MKSSDTSIGVDGLFALTFDFASEVLVEHDDDRPNRMAKSEATWISAHFASAIFV
ncbi:MAG: hypothetical protein ACPHI5_07640 [Acidimicrobiales bacterium]